MNKSELEELLKHFSPNSILIINRYNKLLELFIPFYVKVKYDIGVLKKGDLVKVEGLKLASNGERVYIIMDKAYYPKHFEVL